MSQTVDTRWLFQFESQHFDALGQRMDVAGLARWSNPDAPTLRDANHASVRDGDGLIPDQLVQVFDAQKQDGAAWRCVDVYGPRDERDTLCENMGLTRARDAGLELVAFMRDKTPAPLPAASSENRSAPPVVPIPAREWVDSVLNVHGRDLLPWEYEARMAEAAIDAASFYAIRIVDRTVACLARYDWDGAAQISSVYVEPAFRKTGFATACLRKAVHDSPRRTVFGLIAADNHAMLGVARRAGCESVLSDARRRYVGDWE